MAAARFYTLIVEDDASCSEFIARAIKRNGFESAIAASVGEALLRLEDEWPAAVILDLRLPDADGTVVLRRLRRDPRAACVAVVTGVPEVDGYAELVKCPPEILLSKPVDLRQLIGWLEKAREAWPSRGDS